MEKVHVSGTTPSTTSGTTQCPGWLRTCAPFIVVLSVIGLIVVGLLLFPEFKSMMHYQDCVASGRVDCANTVGSDS